MKKALILILILTIGSCKNTSHEKEEQSQTEIVNKMLQAHGKSTFDSHKITFTVGNTTYTQEQENGRAIQSFSRYKDNIEHKGTYNGGYIEYFIDGNLQEEGSYPAPMLEKSLYGFLYAANLPLSLATNDIRYRKLDEVEIRNKTYFTIQASNVEMPSKIDDQFILYINTEDFLVEYIALNHSLSGSMTQFRRLIYTRKINDVIFQDYIIFTPRDKELPLSMLFKEYNSAQLKDHRTISFQNITVTPRDSLNLTY